MAAPRTQMDIEATRDEGPPRAKPHAESFSNPWPGVDGTSRRPTVELRAALGNTFLDNNSKQKAAQHDEGDIEDADDELLEMIDERQDGDG